MNTETVATPARETAEDRFVQHLMAIDDRGTLAALRRSLGKEPGEVAETCSVVEPFLREGDWRAPAFYLVAGLFAQHPVHSASHRNFGASLRVIRLRDGTTDEDQGVVRRFLAVLDARQAALDVHLRNLITLLHGRAPEAAVDYARLLRDILRWDNPDRRVQRNWANGFWGYQPEAAEPPSDEPGSDDTDDQ